MKDKIIKNFKWIVLIICLILFFAILEDVLESEMFKFDNAVYTTISKFISEPVTIFTKILTTIGSAYVIIPVCLISVIIFLIKKEKRKSIYIFANLITIFLSNQLLKGIIQRPRPEGFRMIEETGYSFPSGHSMVSMAFYGLYIYMIYKGIKNKYLKWTLIALIGVLIIGIGISRIYLGVHYASDVIAGFCLSISYLVLFISLTRINENHK